MTITESRLREGTLTIGAAPDPVLDMSCQVTNARYASAYSDDGDAVETLCGDRKAAGEKSDGGTLTGTFIQDWTAPTATSIILYLIEHDLKEVDYTYTPELGGPSFAGKVRVKLPSEFLGGDVNTRITSDFEWQVTEGWPPTPSAGTGGASAAPTSPAAGSTGTTNPVSA